MALVVRVSLFFTHVFGWYVNPQITLPTKLLKPVYALTTSNILYMMGGYDYTNYPNHPKYVGNMYKWDASNSGIWDPIYPDVFTTLGLTDFSCHSPCSTIINDELMYIFPNREGVYIFNVSSETFRMDHTVTKPKRISNQCLVKDDMNNIYLIGGKYENQTLYTDFDIFNTTTYTWVDRSVIEQLPVPSYLSACVYHDHYIYVFGGHQGTEVIPTELEPISDRIYRYDIGQNNWQLLTSVSLMHRMYDIKAIVGIDSNIYLPGGYIIDSLGFAYESNITHKFDPVGLTMTVIDDLLYKRADSIVIAVDDQIHVMGGQQNVNDRHIGETMIIEVPSQAPSETPSHVPTINPSQAPSDSPSTNPSQMHPLFPTTNPSNVQTMNPTINKSNYTLSMEQPCDCPGCRVKEGLYCLSGTQPYNGNEDDVWCEPCPSNTAGTNGVCNECKGLKEPNHNKDDCVESDLGGYIAEIIATVIGLIVTFVVTVLVFCYRHTIGKKLCPQKFPENTN
eukprot:1028903_1